MAGNGSEGGMRKGSYVSSRLRVNWKSEDVASSNKLKCKGNW